MIAALVRFAIRRAGVVLALAAALLALGGYSVVRARLDVFPEFSPAQVVVQTEAPGLSAELVERFVSAPIEAAVGGIPGQRSLRSQSIPGLSVVTLVFDDASDLHRNRQAVAERLVRVAGQLPPGAGPPNLTPLTSSASTVLGLGLTAQQRSLAELDQVVATTVRPHLMSVAGVADVNVFGGRQRRWEVRLDPQRLLAQGLTVAEAALALRGVAGVAAGGMLETGNQQIMVVAYGQPGSAASLAEQMLSLADGRQLPLSAIGEVAEGHAPVISSALINGTPGVYLSVQGLLGANTWALTAALDAALAELAPALAAEGVGLHRDLFRPASFIETALANLRNDILIGSALVMVVLFLFLYNLRTALISMTAIPLSLLAAVAVLVEAGLSLNVMVLGGLIIALGEVVDDAIIDTENIYRRLRENRASAHPRPAWRVLWKASLEVRASVIYATFIVALVFAPMLLLSGVAGRMFAPLAQAYILAILASLVVALTVTPALCALLLTRDDLPADEPPLVARLKPLYARVLGFVERYPAGVVGLVMTLVLLGTAMIPLFRVRFLPDLREGHYIVHMAAVPGTAVGEMERVAKQVTAELLAIEGVKSVAPWMGRAVNGADTFGTHYSEIEVEVGVASAEEQERILRQIRTRLIGEGGGVRFPGLSFGVNTFLTERIGETISGYGVGHVVEIYGTDLDALEHDAREVAAALARVPGAHDVSIQAPPGASELVVRLRPDALARAGVSVGDALAAVQAAYQGVVVGRLHDGRRPVPVVALMNEAARADPQAVGGLRLRGLGGAPVELRQVADIALASGRYKVLRSGGKRVQIVTCNVRGRDIEAFARDAEARIGREVKLAPGHYVVSAGEAKESSATRNELLVHAAVAMVGVLVLAWFALGNLRNMLLTLLNLPFALVGGLVAAVLGGAWVSVGALVGFVTLFGITLRNAIMLVSHYDHLVRVEGRPWDADTARQGALDRLPSILMTALVTGIGLAPLVIGSGQPGREIEGPMAAIITGGLVTSTLLNLLILPAVMLHFGRFGDGSGASATRPRPAIAATAGDGR